MYSLFILRRISSDIDMLCVSNNIIDTEKRLMQSGLNTIDNKFITINLIAPEIFEREIMSDSPKAIKRIVAFKNCTILKGNRFFKKYQVTALTKISQQDILFQQEFDARKEYLRNLIVKNKDFFILNSSEYSTLFPYFVQFLKGEVDGGFPKERKKVVFPGPMRLKMALDISDGHIEYLE